MRLRMGGLSVVGLGFFLLSGCAGSDGLDPEGVALVSNDGKADSIRQHRVAPHITEVMTDDAPQMFGSFDSQLDDAGTLHVSGALIMIPTQREGNWDFFIRSKELGGQTIGAIAYWKRADETQWRILPPTYAQADSRYDVVGGNYQYYSEVDRRGSTLQVQVPSVDPPNSSDFYTDYNVIPIPDGNVEFGFFPIPAYTTGSLEGNSIEWVAAVQNQ